MVNCLTRTFIPWYGGKHKMAKNILCYIPNYKIETYVEVFGGGMWVLLNKPYSPIEVYNDLNMGLVSTFRCMKDMNKAYELQMLLKNSPYSSEIFKNALKQYDNPDLDDIERAKCQYILATQSFNSTCKNWRKPSSIRDIKAYEKRIAKMLEFVPRLKNVIIENMDFEELIDKYDSPTTFFYLDPPYISETRGAPNVYLHEGDDSLHIRMVDKLLDIKGMALVSGYDHKLYDRISELDWMKVKLGDYAKSSQNSSRGDKKDKGAEFVWKNY